MRGDGGALAEVEVFADLFGGVDAVVEVGDEGGDGALEVDVVLPQGVVGVEEQGLAGGAPRYGGGRSLLLIIGAKSGRSEGVREGRRGLSPWVRRRNLTKVVGADDVRGVRQRGGRRYPDGVHHEAARTSSWRCQLCTRLFDSRAETHRAR